MKPSDFQKTIQCQFDCKLKRVVKGIVRNYRKELKRRRNKEISYCELPEIVVEKLAVWDEYESDYTAFDVCGIEVRVLDDDLAEAIEYYGTAEPPVRCGESHLSGLTEPPHFVY